MNLDLNDLSKILECVIGYITLIQEEIPEEKDFYYKKNMVKIYNHDNIPDDIRLILENEEEIESLLELYGKVEDEISNKILEYTKLCRRQKCRKFIK